MKTERKRTKLSVIIFVFTFFCRSGNEYKNPGNEYGNKYYQKQTRGKYRADTETEVCVDRKLKPFNHREIHRKTNKFNELVTWLQNDMIMLATQHSIAVVLDNCI